MLKNRVNGCHGNHAFFHSAIEFIFEDKNSLCFWGPNERFGTHEKLSWGCKVGQISSRGTEFCSMTIPYEPHREKTGFSPMRNKGADQLRSNSEADQRHCFRYSDRTFPRRPPWPSG